MKNPNENPDWDSGEVEKELGKEVFDYLGVSEEKGVGNKENPAETAKGKGTATSGPKKSEPVIQSASAEAKAEENLFKFHTFFRPMAKPQKLLGREEEEELLEESLYKIRMKNAIIIGPAGCGKTAIVEAVAEKMKSQYLFINFDIPLTVSGTQYRGMFEKKITDALEAVSQFEKAFGKIKKPVLFIDEIHMIYGAGDAEGGTTAGNIIKPYLSGGLVTIIGATTPEEYQKTICKDAALVRRLSPIYIRELKEDVVLKILSAFCSGQLNPSLLLKIYQLSKTLPNTCNPDISIEILDRCLARQKATGEIVDDAMISSIVSYMKNPSD